MARQPSDAFLPSGAIADSRNQILGIPTDYLSSRSHPRPYPPEHIPTPAYPGSSPLSKPYMNYQQPSSQTSTTLRQFPPQSRTPSSTRNEPPVSSSVVASDTVDDGSVALADYWRVHTSNLREQAQGERAHMAADRARLEECMNEERALWEKERDLLKSRIAQLEAQLAEYQISHNEHRPSVDRTTSPTSQNGHNLGHGIIPSQIGTASASGSNGSENVSNSLIPQESGRNPDGSPFYAPAPENPSRTFDTTQAEELRVDSMPAPRETPFRVTSRKLTQSDFGPQSPLETESNDGSVIGDSIDISQIQPELDGVAIKATAVSPTFVAKVLSPNSSLSPSKTSPSVVPPTQPHDNSDGHNGSGRKKSTLEVIAAPENRRLTMHAGHTPNHSVTNIDFGDSGNATPKQVQQNLQNEVITTDSQHLDGVIDELIEADPELQGPLGLKNDPVKDDQFLAALTSKLEEVKESVVQLSPHATSTSDEGLLKDALSILGRTREEQEEMFDPEGSDDTKIPEMPRLKMRPSTNFGRPFGSL